MHHSIDLGKAYASHINAIIIIIKKKDIRVFAKNTIRYHSWNHYESKLIILYLNSDLLDYIHCNGN